MDTDFAVSCPLVRHWRDRKSTRLNSSHGYISYAVFCLKKKKKAQLRQTSSAHIHSRHRRSRSVSWPHVTPPAAYLPLRAPPRRAVVAALWLITIRRASEPDHPWGRSDLRQWRIRCTSRRSLTQAMWRCAEVGAMRPSLPRQHHALVILPCLLHALFFFFLNNPAPPEISPLPPHDPLPILPHDGPNPPLIFRRSDERTNHAAIIAAVAVIQHVQPEGIPGRIRTASQVAEVLHQHKRL